MVTVDHNQLRTMGSETVYLMDWSLPQISWAVPKNIWAVPPERLVHSINRCSSATAGIRSCNLQHVRQPSCLCGHSGYECDRMYVGMSKKHHYTQGMCKKHHYTNNDALHSEILWKAPTYPHIVKKHALYYSIWHYLGLYTKTQIKSFWKGIQQTHRYWCRSGPLNTNLYIGVGHNLVFIYDIKLALNVLNMKTMCHLS